MILISSCETPSAVSQPTDNIDSSKVDSVDSRTQLIDDSVKKKSVRMNLFTHKCVAYRKQTIS